ncbi:hypothetical protein PENTCL1PPCAC_2453, partial [Pristionchus entomophagus]
ILRMEDHFDCLDYDLEGVDVEYEEYAVCKVEEPSLHEENPSTSRPSFVIKGRTFVTNSMLAEAVKAVMRGRMNVNKAAGVYGVPRSSLQRKVAQSREEHKRKDNKEYVEKLEENARRKREADEEEKRERGRERRMWRDDYERKLDEVEANGMILRDHTVNLSYVVNENLIEENVDSLVDDHIYLVEDELQDGNERRELEEDEDDIPPPPQIGMENPQLEDYQEEVIVDELEDSDGIAGMPRLNPNYEF